ncbi:MAG: universal stress protein [Synechococcaceae cyanobacterium]|nr:universal stress protein [Synechococcaceae cyanobacterium]
MSRRGQRRGRLKVFVGMAPGVGKTCRMLQEGREAWRDGIDVVIGLLETHGRAETARMAEGLEQMPRQRIDHHGIGCEELDVEALLARRPQLALVDELAHSNVPGSRRAKRWQDVQRLLDAGIDVYSTLNIQHLERLNDQVTQLTGVVVQERIPSTVLDASDEVVLVDVTPETLQERLREGKVVAAGQEDQALTHFFRRQNLVALRELALLEVADRVESDAGPVSPGLRERLLVCVRNDTAGRGLMRRAARLASALDGPLLALHVQDPQHFLSREEALLQAESAQLCRDMGGTYLQERSSDVAATIARVARERSVSQVLLGASQRPRLAALLRPPMVARLQWQLRGLDIDLHLIQCATEGDPAAQEFSGVPPGRCWLGWGWRARWWAEAWRKARSRSRP